MNLGGDEPRTSGRLWHALGFLLHSRADDGCWAAYPGLPTDVRVTANVLTALRRVRQPAAEEAMAAAAAAIWARYGAASSLSEQVAYLTVAHAAGVTWRDSPGPELVVRFADQGPSTILLAQALLAAEPWPERAAVKSWAHRLLNRQSPDGSWQAGCTPAEAVAATAWAVRALAPWRDEQDLGRAANRGLARLAETVTDCGWDSAALSGTYLLSTTLRALLTGPAEPGLLDDGLDLLRLAQHPAGGWGTRPGEPPTTEHTAAGLLVLAEAEQSGHRVGSAELLSSLLGTRHREAALEADVDARARESSGISASPIATGGTNGGKLGRLDKRMLRNAAFGASLLLGFVANAAIGVFRGEFGDGLIVLAIMGLFVFSSVPIAVYALRRNRREYASPPPQRLLNAFMAATRDLRPAQRSDLVYELTVESGELPGQYAERHFMAHVHRRDFPAETVDALESWIGDYLSADDEARRSFLTRLREVT